MLKHLIIFVALAGLALLAAGCGGGAATPDDTGTLNITQDDFMFTPDSIELKVGQKVRMILTNISKEDHKFVVGRSITRTLQTTWPRRADGVPDGFKVEFFDGVEVKVIGPAKRVLGGGAILTREGEMSPAKAEDIALEEYEGFMVQKGPSLDSTIIEFIVPNKVGEWEFACFEDNGEHYDAGMFGKLVVVGG